VARPYVDAVKLLDVVDGYRVGLDPTPEDESDEVDLTYEADDDS